MTTWLPGRECNGDAREKKHVRWGELPGLAFLFDSDDDELEASA